MTKREIEDRDYIPDNLSLTRRMSSLVDHWEDNDDRRAIFLGCYSLMTANIMTAVRRRQFKDGRWVTSFRYSAQVPLQ